MNNFYNLYKNRRAGTFGPSTHIQQDIYRAMLVFACAGLDVFIKKLVHDKLPQLLAYDKNVEERFADFVGRDLRDDKIVSIQRLLALALVNPNPRAPLLERYLREIAGGSLQSVGAVENVIKASCLESEKIITTQNRKPLQEAFGVRNEIIHEMDINVENNAPRSRRYRTRRQRSQNTVERHTKAIVGLAITFFTAYKKVFVKYSIGVKSTG
ncbi:MAG: hypothetical protein HY975_00120 [Candidatus Kerfeldbacteria bacterium]|nr:hypothetical protein [Candidatus Kerfeldbacteria bacterium]